MGASTALEANRVGLLHTAQVHVATFDELAQQRGLTTLHSVQEHWLTRAIESGMHAELRQQVVEELRRLAEQCPVVICTCSTLGELAAELSNPNVYRVDEPMMHQAAGSDGTTLLAYCLPSTRKPSAQLLEAAYNAAGKPADYHVVYCETAWPFFERGETLKFGQAIAHQIEQEIVSSEISGVSAIVLAQASMAAALQPLAQLGIPILSSPASAMDHASTLLRN